MSSAAPAIASVRNVRLRQIALPTEHGGWGFLLEPLVAGLAVAFSPAAPWIAVMAIGAFLTRQPLKVLIADRFGMRNRERASASFTFVMLYSGVFLIGLTGTLLTTGSYSLTPFAAVLPLVVFQIYIDVSRQSRQLIPEITGAVTISSSIAVMAMAGGLDWASALALWSIFAARLIPSIIYVRHRLRLEKGKVFSKTAVLIAHIAAIIVVSFLAYLGLSPILAAAAMVILLIRASNGLSARRTKLRAMQIGVWEVMYGALTVISVVVGHFTGF